MDDLPANTDETQMIKIKQGFNDSKSRWYQMRGEALAVPETQWNNTGHSGPIVQDTGAVNSDDGDKLMYR